MLQMANKSESVYYESAVGFVGIRSCALSTILYRYRYFTAVFRIYITLYSVSSCSINDISDSLSRIGFGFVKPRF